MITSHDYFIPAKCLQKQWSVIIFNLLIVSMWEFPIRHIFCYSLNGLILAIFLLPLIQIQQFLSIDTSNFYYKFTVCVNTKAIKQWPQRPPGPTRPIKSVFHLSRQQTIEIIECRNYWYIINVNNYPTLTKNT